MSVEKEKQTEEKLSFSERFKQPVKQWIKCGFWSLVYILFIAWVGNFWWLLLLPFIVDVFISKFIPWTWWKKSKNKTVRSVMSWVDAIVFALVAVYFINTFVFQNYQIPTSSLEKTLLVGDFLFVSKASYGPRIPNTPFSFPLVQNTFPIINTKSYFEKPQWEYRRMKGFTNIKRNDIVVFNFPTGDTVAVKEQNPDYYIQCYYIGQDIVEKRIQNGDSTALKLRNAEAYHVLGRNYILKNPNIFGEVMWRPVDRRENYVKRCVGMPGDKFEIVNNQIFVNGQPQEKFPGIEFNYFVQTDGTILNLDRLEKMDISKDDFKVVNNPDFLLNIGLQPDLPAYRMPLTEENYNRLNNASYVKKIIIEPEYFGGDVFPLGGNYGWTRDNFGPLQIPAAGQTFDLNLENLPIYRQIIVNYEQNKLEVRDSTIYINDQVADSYTFKMDYYWMMGDNRHNSADSRSWGFVPEDHVVGRPVFVWLSLDKDKSWFGGKIRWNRFFKDAKR